MFPSFNYRTKEVGKRKFFKKNLHKFERWGSNTNRKTAMAVLKEIVESCDTVGINHISLKPVTEPEGFELHIKDHFDEKGSKCVEAIIQKHNLSTKKMRGS
jgi:hypothetical protein